MGLESYLRVPGPVWPKAYLSGAPSLEARCRAAGRASSDLYLLFHFLSQALASPLQMPRGSLTRELRNSFRVLEKFFFYFGG